jgi:hypothetical protein
MKIYKRNPLDIDLGGAEALILPAIAIIVVLLLGIWALGGANGTVISARLIQNPLTLSSNDSTLLQVQLSNPTAQMAQNVTVQVTAPSAPLGNGGSLSLHQQMAANLLRLHTMQISGPRVTTE